MRVNYNEILRDHIAIEMALRAIEEDAFSIATEASTEEMMHGTTVNGQTQNNNNAANNQQNQTDTEVSEEAKRKFTDTIKKFIDKLIEMFNRAKIAINNIMKKMWTTDAGFMKNYQKMKATTKPIEGYEAIVYQYKDNYLENTCGGFLRDIRDRANRVIANENGDDPEADQIIRETISKYSNNNEQNVSEFINNMISEYRGEKKTIRFNRSMIGALERVVQTGASGSAYKNFVQETNQGITNLRAKQNAMRANASKEQIKAMAKKCAIVTNLYNAMFSVERTYYSLKTEHYLSARTCLQKFYS